MFVLCSKCPALLSPKKFNLKAILAFFPPSYATFYVLEEKNSVSGGKNTKIVQDIYYIKQIPT